jgi:nucleoside-diphosphate-sugar epimerase
MVRLEASDRKLSDQEDRMKVFVTGASGYVGFRVVQRLLARGHEVIGLARSDVGTSRLQRAGAVPLLGDLRQADLLAQAARQTDATLHLGFTHDGDFAEAVQVDHRAHATVVEALAATENTLIVSNGTGGFGNRGDQIVDETAPVDLDYPVAVRNRAENLVTSVANLRGIAVRLPLLVYGHGGSVFLPMLIGSARERAVAAYVGQGQNKMSVVHVDDAAGLYVLALERGQAGQVYLAAAGQDVSFRDIAHAVAENVGASCRFDSLTLAEASEVWNSVWAFLLSLTNRVAGDKARRDLGWSPRSTPDLLEDVARGSSLARTVASA